MSCSTTTIAQGGQECGDAATHAEADTPDATHQRVPSCNDASTLSVSMRTQLFLNHRPSMSPLVQHVITALMILSIVIAGCAQHDPYIAAALEHADRAITKGEERDNNALAEQATVALRYAWLA